MKIPSQWYTNHLLIEALERNAGLREKTGDAIVNGGVSFTDLFESYLDPRQTVSQPATSQMIMETAPFMASPAIKVGDAESRQKIENGISRAAEKYQLPPQLIRAVMKAESNFNPQAVSSAGAQGLMQLMPKTARAMGVTNSFDIEQNIEGGAKYLKSMMDRFKSVPLALAAYNAGPGNVEKHGGIPPFKETKAYVSKIMKSIQKDFV